ncbi:MAG: thioesterase family protein [Acidimicrobiales bacterium]|nr:thioesterase family protein [Acidimicrobiales bacterium]
MAFSSRFRNSIRVRYGEVDQQGVVFNAHYMAYIDDTLEHFMSTLGDLRDLGWDMMMKKIDIEWQGSAGNGDVVDVDVAAVRWGNTSFELGYAGSVEGRPVFTSTVLYVSVQLGTTQTMPTPVEVVEAFGPAVDRPS